MCVVYSHFVVTSAFCRLSNKRTYYVTADVTAPRGPPKFLGTPSLLGVLAFVEILELLLDVRRRLLERVVTWRTISTSH